MFDTELSIHSMGGYTKEDVVAMLEKLQSNIKVRLPHREDLTAFDAGFRCGIGASMREIELQIDTLERHEILK